ncbi:MAG: ABC transporter ATP-binding protein [Anaerolineae bacterium]
MTITKEEAVGNTANAVPLLQVRNLKKYFAVKGGSFSQKAVGVKAVDDVSLEIGQGETLGLVGETGCGKTTVGRCIVRLYKPLAGQILYRHDSDEGNASVIDLASMSERELRPHRRDIQMIFQDPYSSLDPRQTVFDTISEPIAAHRIASGRELEDRVIHLMQVVGLETRYLHRYPHAFSGGQRQRIGIARALATSPKLVVADEPVSALDVSIQAQVLNLLRELQDRLGLSFLFIAHDLSVVNYVSHRVAVMYAGRLVEVAPTEELYTQPLHPYTQALLSSVPISDPDSERKRIHLTGEVPNPVNLPPGCLFHPRCRYADDKCRRDPPPELMELQPGHCVACHYAAELELRGVT